MAVSTCFITPLSKRPIFSRRRRLSRVRTCSSRITDSLGRPQLSGATEIWVGSRAFPVWEVMAAAMTVGLCRFPVSFCTMRTGRTPPCSLPTTGLKSA